MANYSAHGRHEEYQVREGARGKQRKIRLPRTKTRLTVISWRFVLLLRPEDSYPGARRVECRWNNTDLQCADNRERCARALPHVKPLPRNTQDEKRKSQTQVDVSTHATHTQYYSRRVDSSLIFCNCVAQVRSRRLTFFSLRALYTLKEGFCNNY